MGKILLTLAADMIAPRFDLATEVLIVTVAEQEIIGSPRAMLLPGPSADELCGLIMKEDISTLICGGIEDGHYQFLVWKKVKVIDRVIGTGSEVLKKFLAGELQNGAVVLKKNQRGGGKGEKVPAKI